MKFLSFVLLSFLLIAASCNNQPASKKTILEKADPTVTTKKTEAVRPVHWSYTDEDGPSGWASLSPAYAACGSGKSQSPVDIISSSPKGNSNFKIEYKITALQISHNEHMEELINNGHTIQITPQHGSTVTYEGKQYHLKQFHFHTPGEHTLNGRNFPMEIHFVHEADDKKLLVIGVMVKEGNLNNNFNDLIKHLPNAVGEKLNPENVNIDLALHIPKDIFAFHYMGSLTTPPCTEDVQWMVLQNFIEMSKDQVAAFSSRMKNNNRPTQPLNNRRITIDDIKTLK